MQQSFKSSMIFHQEALLRLTIARVFKIPIFILRLRALLCFSMAISNVSKPLDILIGQTLLWILFFLDVYIFYRLSLVFTLVKTLYIK